MNQKEDGEQIMLMASPSSCNCGFVVWVCVMGVGVAKERGRGGRGLTPTHFKVPHSPLSHAPITSRTRFPLILPHQSPSHARRPHSWGEMEEGSGSLLSDSGLIASDNNRSSPGSGHRSRRYPPCDWTVNSRRTM